MKKPTDLSSLAPTGAGKLVLPLIHKHTDIRPELLWLVVPAIVFANTFWYIVAQIFHGLNSVSAAEVLWRVATLLLTFGLMLGTVLLIPYFVRHRGLVALAILLTAVNVIWYLPLTWVTASMVVVTFSGAWFSSEIIWRDLRDRIKINVRGTLGRGTTWAVLGVLLAIALAQYQVISQALGPRRSVDQLVDRSVTAVEKILPRFVKNYRPEMSIGELVDAKMPTADSLLKDLIPTGQLTNKDLQQLELRLNDQGVKDYDLPSPGSSDAQVRQAIDAEIKKFQDQATSDILTGLGQQFHVQLGQEKTVHQVLQSILNQKLSPAAIHYTIFIPPIIAVALFLLLRLLTPIFVLLIVIGGWAWYRVLHLAKIVSNHIETVEAERVTWHKPD